MQSIIDYARLQNKWDTSSTLNMVYIGYAQPGISQSEAKWLLKRVNTSTGEIQFACHADKTPCNEFQFKWSERTSLTYADSQEKTAPTLVSIAKDSTTQLTITLSEFILASTATKSNNGGFVVTETGGTATYAVTEIAPGATADLVVLTVEDFDASRLAGVTVTYARGGNGTIQDEAGNYLATDATGLVVPAWDTAPTMESAERLSNTVLRVTLSEDALDASITKANDGGFVVFETGTPTTTYAVSAIAKSGSDSSKIELTVADVVASSAVGLTVTYVQGGNGDVQDLASNLMETDATGVVIASW